MLDIQIESVYSANRAFPWFVMTVALIIGPCLIDCKTSSTKTLKDSVGKTMDAGPKYSARDDLQSNEGRRARALREEIFNNIFYDSSEYRDDDYIYNIPGNDAYNDGSSAINGYNSAFGYPGYHSPPNGSHTGVPKIGYGSYPNRDSQQPLAPPPQYPVNPYSYSNWGPPDAANAMKLMQRMGYSGGHGWGQIGRGYGGGDVGGWGRPKRSPHYGGGWYKPRPPPPIVVIKERGGGFLEAIPIFGLVSFIALLGSNMLTSGSTTVLTVTGPPGAPGATGATGAPGLPGAPGTNGTGTGRRKKRSLSGEEVDVEGEVTYVSPDRIIGIQSPQPPEIPAKTNNSEVVLNQRSQKPWVEHKLNATKLPLHGSHVMSTVPCLKKCPLSDFTNATIL